MAPRRYNSTRNCPRTLGGLPPCVAATRQQAPGPGYVSSVNSMTAMHRPVLFIKLPTGFNVIGVGLTPVRCSPIEWRRQQLVGREFVGILQRCFSVSGFSHAAAPGFVSSAPKQ